MEKMSSDRGEDNPVRNDNVGGKDNTGSGSDAAAKTRTELRGDLFRMVSVGVVNEPINQVYDVITIGAVVANLAAAIMSTFDSLNAVYGELFVAIETITCIFFAVDYILRIITAPELYPDKTDGAARLTYITSAAGIIDLLSFLPNFLPIFFPSGLAAFKMFRVVRILRLFRINAYYDSLNVITDVLRSKRQQLLSSVFMILILMMGASLCMYGLEHDAQPEVFRNAFSGIWWAASTLLTVGYGDIYPVTTLGKIFGIIITFLGVGIVAIPTGIISAGFVEQYTLYKRSGNYVTEEDLNVVHVKVLKDDPWVGLRVDQLKMPHGIFLAGIRRSGDVIVARDNVILTAGDILILAAKKTLEDQTAQLQEFTLSASHPWVGMQIDELDISRLSYILGVRRREKFITPHKDLILREGDEIYMYTKQRGIREDNESNDV